MRQIDTIADFERWLDVESGSAPFPVAVQSLDLRDQEQRIAAATFDDAIFLACELSEPAAGHIVMTGGVVIPDLSGFDFTVHRSTLYTVAELFDGFDPADPDGYAKSYDQWVHQQYLQQGASPRAFNTSLARRLHDHSITEALEDALLDETAAPAEDEAAAFESGAKPRRSVVAIMGGHSMERSEPMYASVARISRELTRRGFLMISGGGPGAMEATHLGAFVAARPDDDLERALALLRPRPSGAVSGKEYADGDWLHRAWAVREQLPIPAGTEEQCKSIGVPTWLYGHEPPTVFATHIAKYFANSVREDGLLALASHGVVFAPGSAGTTQEIFQDAAQNHYGTQGLYSPMILFGSDFWTTTRPVWPLLTHVAEGHRYGELLALTDSETEVVDRITAYDPTDYSAD